jgi:inorganic pyrophosphatase
MVRPAFFALGMPIFVGLVFRFVGEQTGQLTLGVEVLCGLMMFETLTGLMMAMFLDNSGGAWDNAKKYIEAGAHGGKGSDAHMASVTGDTVGDPFKDTAGPALHVIITTMTTTCLVLGPVFIGNAKATQYSLSFGLSGGGVLENMMDAST